MLRRPLHLVLLPIVLLVFLFGVLHLFELRFSRGDFYPPYSSLRADPLGVKALYESLERSGLHRPERFFAETPRLGDGTNTTLLVLGTQPGALNYLPQGELKLLEQFLHTGGQIVVALHPYRKQPYRDKLRSQYYGDDVEDSEDEERKPRQPPSENPTDRQQEKPDEDAADDRISHESLTNGWGFAFEWPRRGEHEEGTVSLAPAVRTTTAPSLPATMPWHSAISLAFASPGDWNVWYRADGKPVVAGREFGRGKLLLLTDSWLFSNEALRDGRQTRFLSWLFAGRERALFDETHLGVQSSEGVATLARKYRLHGLAVGLFLLTVLFLWRSSTSLVPPRDDLAVSGAAVAGRHSQDGFVNLLRRSVRPAQLLSTCHAQWRATHPGGGRHAAVLEQALDDSAEKPTSANLINRYRAACRALKSRATARADTPSQSTNRQSTISNA